jgi:hypothetical protein
MSNLANAEAVIERLRGKAASRPRAAVMSASAGVAVAALAYRLLRQPAGD